MVFLSGDTEEWKDHPEIWSHGAGKGTRSSPRYNAVRQGTGVVLGLRSRLRGLDTGVDDQESGASLAGKGEA